MELKPHPLKGRPSPHLGKPSPLRGRGKYLAWLKDHVDHQGEGCLIWPFWRDPDHGGGRLGVNGKIYWAHNYMCNLVHGPAPTDKPQAAHSCGNRHLGCVHPKHLDWSDNSGNQRDRRAHGRPEGGKGTRTHLTPAQVEEIRSAKGKIPQFTLARLLGVKRGTIEYWQRTTHAPLPQSTNPYNIARRGRR